MKISIIIPSYRQPHFLGRAIGSCLEQDHENLEVIVVDDRSRDASLAIALSFANIDERVKVIECETNGGLGKARNIGIAHATGDYLCFLDSDDYLLDCSLSARIEALPAALAQHGENVFGVYGDWQHVAESIDYPTVRQPRASMPIVDASTYTGENVFICSAPIVKRDAVVDSGGFPEGLRMLEDFALWAKMIAAGAIFVPVHHVVCTYRQRPNSMLRGDGLVVMADHVAVINEWMASSGTPLAESGAMSAWLANSTPFSYGRMAWNVPSVLGSYGGLPGAHAVDSTHSSEQRPVVTSSVEDFMSHSRSTGLSQPTPSWQDLSDDDPAVAIVVGTLAQSLEAVGIVLADPSLSVAIFADDAQDWPVTWPLALAGYAVRPTSELDLVTNESIVDLRQADHRFAADRDENTRVGINDLWPLASDSHGSIVYVPESLAEYPALDAWISVALHALAEAGLDPTIMTDPAMRPNLGGYRSDFVSIEELRSATVVVTASGTNIGLVEQLTGAVIFEPSTPGDHARTAGELRNRLQQELGH